MKELYYSGLFFLLSLVLFSACKESSSGPEQDKLEGIYFPHSNGTSYKYNINRSDSSGTQTAGTRGSTYQGTQMVGSTEFQVQIDTLTVSGIPQSITNFSLFYSTETSAGGNVVYYIDTTGFSAFLPDSLPITINVDTLIRLFSFPFGTVKEWPVFMVTIDYGFLQDIPVIDVKGYYQGTEKVDINLSSGIVQKDAAKIRYVLTLRIDIDNPFETREYEAFAWVAEGIGVVKWQGSGAVLSAFTGTGIDLGDTTSVVTQELVQYSIK